MITGAFFVSVERREEKSGTHHLASLTSLSLNFHYKPMHLKYLFALLIFFAGEVRAQAPSIEWQQCFGGSGIDALRNVNDSLIPYIVLSGGTYSNDGEVNGNHGIGTPDAWLVIIDSSDNIISQKCFGGSQYDDFESMKILSNGNFLFWGSTQSNDGDVSGNHNPGIDDAWLVETDNVGNIIREKCYGGSAYDAFADLKQTSDGGYILAGLSASIDGDIHGNHGNGDVWILKIDSAWDTLWSKCYGGSGTETSYCIYSTNDGGFVVGGFTDSNDGDVFSPLGGNDYWLVKIDSVGDLLWERTFGGSLDDIFRGMVQANNGGYVLSGYTNSHDGNITGSHDTIYSISDLWVVKVDDNGNIQWQKCLGGTREEEQGLRQIINDYDSGFIILGTTNSNDGDVSGNHGTACAPYPCDDIWMVKIDSIGTVQWQRCLGGSGSEQSYSCSLSRDSGYLITGTGPTFDGDGAGSNSFGGIDSWVVKLSAATTGIAASTNPITDFTCYLSPTTNLLSLSFYANGNERTQVELLDITGRVLLQQPLAVTAGFNKQEVQAGQLAAGVYVARLITEGGSVVKKLIKN